MPKLPAPTNITIDLLNDTNVIVLWDEISDGSVQQFIILRNENNGPLTEIGRVNGNLHSFTDKTSIIGKTYSYVVKTHSTGFIDGTADPKIITIVKQQTDSATNISPTSYPTTTLAINNNSISWATIIGLDFVMAGILILIYSYARRTILAASPIKETKNKLSPLNLKVKLSNANRQTEIVPEAKTAYKLDYEKKITDWVDEVDSKKKR